MNTSKDLTVVKPNDSNQASTTFVDDTPVEDNREESNVKFTVILPPKKVSSPSNEDEDEKSRPAKRQRRRRASEESGSEDDNHQEDRQQKIHFTVTIDPKSKVTKELANRINDSSGLTNKKRSTSREK